MKHWNVISHVDRTTVVGHIALRRDGYHWHTSAGTARGVSDNPGEAARLCAIAAGVP